MKIETPRLILREMCDDDFEKLYEIFSDAETMKYYPHPFDEAKVRQWIEWNQQYYESYNMGLLVVTLKESSEVIGDCGVTMQNINGHSLPEIGYHINKNFWYRGYAKEAAIACRDWAFENKNFDFVCSYMKYSNVASIATAKSIGMTFYQQYPDEKNGITVVYSITRERWNQICKSKCSEV